MMNLRKILAVLAAALLFLGACGGSDDGDDDASSDATEASDSGDDSSDDSGDDIDLGDLGDLDEDCLTASGAAITLGLMPLMFAFSAMGDAFTDDTLYTENDIKEMETAIEDLQDAVPDELEEDVDTLATMTSDAFDDPDAFDEEEWESAMEGINAYLEDECGGALEGLGEELEGLEGDLEDLSDMSIPDLSIPD